MKELAHHKDSPKSSLEALLKTGHLDHFLSQLGSQKASFEPPRRTLVIHGP